MIFECLSNVVYFFRLLISKEKFFYCQPESNKSKHPDKHIHPLIHLIHFILIMLIIPFLLPLSYLFPPRLGQHFPPMFLSLKLIKLNNKIINIFHILYFINIFKSFQQSLFRYIKHI